MVVVRVYLGFRGSIDCRPVAVTFVNTAKPVRKTVQVLKIESKTTEPCHSSIICDLGFTGGHEAEKQGHILCLMI